MAESAVAVSPELLLRLQKVLLKFGYGDTVEDFRGDERCPYCKGEMEEGETYYDEDDDELEESDPEFVHDPDCPTLDASALFYEVSKTLQTVGQPVLIEENDLQTVCLE